MMRTFEPQQNLSRQRNLISPTRSRAVEPAAIRQPDEAAEAFAPAASTPFAHDFSRIPVRQAGEAIHAQLSLSEPGDAYEQEAERLADQMMRTEEPALSAAPPPVSRAGAACEGDGKTLQPAPSDSRAADARGASELRTLAGGGSPLPESTRAFFESKLGHDFTAVRIHSDSGSAHLARRLQARAFTLGQDVVFGPGEYAPGTATGARLLAHELTHVVQQASHSTAAPTIQRQPVRGGRVLPPPPHTSVDDLNDQIRIIAESSVPNEILSQPENLSLVTPDDIKSLLFNRKLKAIVRLAELKNESAVLTLIAVLEDKIVAIKTLDPLQQSLLKQEAANSLSAIGGAAALAKLNDLLVSKDPKARLLAARAFPGAVDPQAFAGLLAQLKQEADKNIKAQIIFALGELGGRMGAGTDKELIAKALIREMENNTGELQLAAIRALGKLAPPSALQPLLKQLKLWQSVEETAVAIIDALGEIHDDQAVEMLVIMLEKHPSKKVRRAAALALGKIGGTKAQAALKGRLKAEKDADVQAEIQKALNP